MACSPTPVPSEAFGTLSEPLESQLSDQFANNFSRNIFNGHNASKSGFQGRATSSNPSPLACSSSCEVSSRATQIPWDTYRSITPESALLGLPMTIRERSTISFSQATTYAATLSQAPHTLQSAPAENSILKSTCITQVWRRIQSFIMVAKSSSLIASALASMDISGHPCVGQSIPSDTTDSMGSNSRLRWTLSALLALFLRSGASVPTEESLLAGLWTMESWSSAHRSPATVVLGDYLKHLAVFDPIRATMLASSWRENFCALRAAVVKAQLELLEALNWDVKVDNTTIAHCHRQLFGTWPVYSYRTASTIAAAAAYAEAEAWAAAAASAISRGWKDPAGACASLINSLCASVTTQSARIAASMDAASAAKRAFSATISGSLPETESSTLYSLKEEPIYLRATKRARVTHRVVTKITAK